MILYSSVLDDAIADLAQTVERYSHIDPARVLCVAADRAAPGRWGGLAECIALGLPEAPTVEFSYRSKSRRIEAATPWHIPRNRRVTIGGARILYVVRFRFPRFLKGRPAETLVHELLHISERFDGSHRALRHGKWFDRYVADIEREWRRKGDPALLSILDLDFEGLRRRFGAVACRCFRRPFRTPLRLPAPEAGQLDSLPAVRRLGLKVDAATIRPLPLEFDAEDDLHLTEDDLEFRVYHARGSKRIARELALAHPDSAGRP